jgi:hypothetical protein
VTQANNLLTTQKTGIVSIRDHSTNYQYIRKDGQSTTRSISYNDEVTYTLSLSNADYINLDDSAFFIHVRFLLENAADVFDITKTVQPVLALGAASFIRRIRIEYNDKVLNDIDEFAIFMATRLQMEAPKHYHNEESGFNCYLFDDLYYSGDSLLLPEEAPDGRVSYVRSLKVPLDQILNGVGFIPMFYLGSGLKIRIWFETQHAPFAAWFTPVCAYAESEVFTTAMENKIGYEHFARGWEITDSYIYAHTVSAKPGAELPDAAYGRFVNSTLTKRIASQGLKEERFEFKLNLRSLNKMHTVFIDPDIRTAQDPAIPSMLLWTRAGRIGRQYLVTAADTNGVYQDYCPVIQWAQIEYGGKKYPSDIGFGRQGPNRGFTDNVQIFYQHYLEFLGRNYIDLSTFIPCLVPHDELNHGLNRNYFLNVENSITDTNPRKMGVNYFRGGPITTSPTWHGHNLSLYGGQGLRWRPKILNSPDTSPEHRYIEVNDFHGDGNRQLPGGQFILCNKFGPVDKTEHLMQGVPVTDYSILLTIERSEKIDTNKTSDWTSGGNYENAWHETNPPWVSPGALRTDTPPKISIIEAAPICLTFFNYMAYIEFEPGDVNISN